MQVSKWLLPFALLSCYTAAFFASVWNGFIDYDSSAFSAIGLHVLKGKALYTEVWDAKPPGVYMLNALALAVFGVSQSSIWILQYLNGIAQVMLIYSIVARISVHRFVPAIGTLLYVLVLYISPIYQGGNFTEEYANTFLLAGILSSIRFVKDERTNDLFLATCLFATSTLFKEPYLFSAIPWVIWLIIRHSETVHLRQRILTGVKGGLLPYLAILIYLGLNGAIFGYWKHLIYNHAYSNYEAIPFIESLSRSYDFFWEALGGSTYWVGFLTILLIVSLIINKGLHREIGIVLLIEFLLGVYSVSMSGYQFQHYLLQLFPSVILCTTLVLEKVAKGIPSRYFSSAIAAFSVFILYTGYVNVQKIQGDINSESSITLDREATESIAAYINDRKSNESRLFVEDIANTDLYLKTDMISDQYIPVNFFSFFVVPDKYGYERGEKYVNSFYDNPPEFIVQSEKKGMLTQHKDLNRWFTEKYRKVTLPDVESLSLYSRK